MKLYKRRSGLIVYANDGSKTEAADLSGLDYEFTVLAKLPEKKNKKNKTNPVTAFVKIMKLSEGTRDKLRAETTGVKIDFGYDREMFELFEGVNTNVVHEYDPPNWITKIYASHAWDAYKGSWFSRSYVEETKVRTIINDVAGSFGLPVVNNYDRSDVLLGGEVFYGESKDVMDSLADDYDLTWEIANNTVTVNDSLNPPLVDKTRVAILGPSILNGPIVEESLENENKKNEKVVRRVRATSMLLPYLYPGVPVQFQVASMVRAFSGIETTQIKAVDESAIYICDEVIHRGTSMTTQCVTELTTKEEKL